jgi:hypothetical protein
VAAALADVDGDRGSNRPMVDVGKVKVSVCEIYITPTRLAVSRQLEE